MAGAVIKHDKDHRVPAVPGYWSYKGLSVEQTKWWYFLRTALSLKGADLRCVWDNESDTNQRCSFAGLDKACLISTLSNLRVAFAFRTPNDVKVPAAAVYSQDILHRAHLQRFCATDSLRLENSFR